MRGLVLVSGSERDVYPVGRTETLGIAMRSADAGDAVCRFGQLGLLSAILSAGALGQQAEPPPVLPPGDLQATFVSATQVQLTWADNSDNEVGFQIMRCRRGASVCEFFFVGANSTSWLDEGLAECLTLRYWVRAYKLKDGAPWVTPFIGPVTVTTLPLAPTGLRARAEPLSTSSVRLDWTGPGSRAEGYEVERCIGAGCVFVGTTSETSLVDSGLEACTEYAYRVRAFKLVDGGRFYSNYNANAAKVTTLPVIPVLRVSTRASTSPAGSSVDLAWNSVPGATGFKVGRCEGEGCTSITRSAEFTGSETLYSDDSVEDCQTYRYRVRALADGKMCEPSKFVTATAPPAAPQLDADSSDPRGILLAWTRPGRECEFELQQCAGGGGECLSLLSGYAPGESSSPPVEIEGLEATVLATEPGVVMAISGYEPCLDFGFQVRATKITDAQTLESAYSKDDARGVTRSRTPDGLVARALSAKEVRLSWVDPPPSCTTGFQIERCASGDCKAFGETSGDKLQEHLLGEVGSVGFPDDTVEQCGRYEYRVRSFRGIGGADPLFSPYTALATALTPIEDLEIDIPSAGSGNGAVVPPKSQPMAQVSIGRKCDYTATGVLGITFRPEEGILGGTGQQYDSLVGLSRSRFEIPRGERSSDVFQFQTHTVAGTIEITALQEKETADGEIVESPGTGRKSVHVDRLPPVILGAQLTPAPGNQRYVLSLDGFSTPREVRETRFEIRLESGDSLISAPESFGRVFSDWFGRPESWDYGSCFNLQVEIDFSHAKPSEMSVQLTNSVGTSAFTCGLRFPNGSCTNAAGL